MQLWINAINNNILENLESLLYSDDRAVAQRFSKNLPGETYEQLSPQYELQVLSAMQIRKVLGPNAFKNIKWLYFGTEQCEYLLPTVEETQRAVDLWQEFDKKYTTNQLKLFSFVTPYYGNPAVRQRMLANFEYLNSHAAAINRASKTVEIIVNDFWTLKLLQNYPNLKPVLWRMLLKTLKNPVVDTYGLDENVHVPGAALKNKDTDQIKELKKEIADNQRTAFGRSAINNSYFISFLERYWISRSWIDYQVWYKRLFDTEFVLDIYYPYALIFIGRLCDTSAVEKIKRWYYPIDEICPRTCWKYDLSIKDFNTSGYKLIQRWNAQYKTQLELEFLESTVEKYENRLIYTPML